MTKQSTERWPAAAVEMWPIARLVPHARNARTHSEDQIEKIAASMQQWGWTNPVLVDEGGTIIAGHGRVMAAKSLGFDVAPVMVARGWTEEQKSAYGIADNQLPMLAEWDVKNLAEELSMVRSAGIDIGLTGFTDEDLAELMGAEPVSTMTEILTTEVEDKFWISLRGPLALQADVIEKVKAIVQEAQGVTFEVGVISLEP